ncbi:Hsp70 protein-domain-containing protein [Aspergillus recurvatus]
MPHPRLLKYHISDRPASLVPFIHYLSLREYLTRVLQMSEGVLAIQPVPRRRRRRCSKTRLSIASLCLLFVLLFTPRANAHPLEDRSKHRVDFEERLIAIHLGATESRVGVINDNQVHVLGTIPSFVTTMGPSLVAGDTARGVDGPNLFKAAFDMMNYFADERTGSTVLKRPHDMFTYSMQNRHQTLQVSSNGTSSSFTPTEIFAPVLSELHSVAESYLGSWVNITGAVIAFPYPYGYNGIDVIDNFVDDIRRAGELVNLPIVRTVREVASIAIALGLDVLSEIDGDRYALLYDLAEDSDTLTVTVFGVEDGVFDTLSIQREYHIAEAGYLEKKDPRSANTINSAVLDRLDEDFTLEHPGFDKRGVNTGCLKRTPCLSCHVQTASIHAIHNALTKARLSVDQITDLIFTPAFRSFPRLQERVAGWFNNTTRVANSGNLHDAAVWGATLMSKYLAEDDWWVGSSCPTSCPAIGISPADDSVVEVIPAAQSLPSFGKQLITAPCSDTDQERKITVMNVYLRDIPAVDFHAKFELGDQYVFDPTPEDIFLGAFELPTSCGSKKSSIPPAIEVSAFLGRDSVLRVQATNMESGEARTLTFPDANTYCGYDERHSPRNFTLTFGEDLEVEYEIDLRRFVGPSRDQKPVEAFDRALFLYP